MANIINSDMGVNQMPPQQIRIDPSSLTDICCSNCGGKLFREAYMFKKISAIVSPSGREEIIPFMTYQCLECGNINDEFLPRIPNQQG